MSDSNFSYVDLVNSLDKVSLALKQKVIENVFSLNDLVDVCKQEVPKKYIKKDINWREIDGMIDKYTNGWRLTEMKGVTRSKVDIIRWAAIEEMDKRQKIISERDEIAEERKIKAFKRENHQPMFDKISMKEKEKTWQNIGDHPIGVRTSSQPNWPLSGNCEFCVKQVSLPKSPMYNEKCERNKYIMKRIENLMDLGSHYGNMNRKNEYYNYAEKRNFEISFLSYTKEVSFYWVIYPSLRVVLACDSCAVRNRLME